MKFYKIAIFTGILLLTACSKQYCKPPANGSGKDDIVFTAYIEDDAITKTYLDSAMKNHWNANDDITIFKAFSYNRQYRFLGKDGARSGAFKDISGVEFATGFELTTNYALYPYKEETSIDEDGVITYDLPAVQPFSNGSFSIGYNPMVAVTSSSSNFDLIFQNVCGYLGISIKGSEKLKSVTLTGKASEPLAGEAAITAVHGSNPTVSMASTAAKSIKLDCGDGVTLDPDVATLFLFVLPSTTFGSGFTIRMEDDMGAYMEKSTSKQVVVSRNEIYRLSAFTYSPSTVLTLSADSFAPSDNSAATKVIDVTSNKAWSVASNQSWCTVSPSGGTRSGSFTISLEANSTFVARTATVTISSGDGTVSRTITVSQPAKVLTFTLSSSSYSISYKGSEKTLALTANASWTAVCDSTWCTVSPASGEGNADLKITVAPSTLAVRRSATITVTVNTPTPQSKSVAITQSAYNEFDIDDWGDGGENGGTAN
jgi:hypothetical protein